MGVGRRARQPDSRPPGHMGELRQRRARAAAVHRRWRGPHHARRVNKENADRYARSSAHTDYKEFRGRDHYTVGADGWEDVADYARTWATQHAPWSRRVIARRRATAS